MTRRSSVASVALVAFVASCVQPIGVGSDAPDFQAVSLATGRQVSFDEAYRGQVTLVNIWATWCEPCKEEIPALDTLYRSLADRGFRLAAVSIDTGDSTAVRQFLDQFGVAFDVLHDPERNIERIYQTTGVPESYLIDRDGRIVRIVYGDHPWGSPANRRIVESLLDQEST
ncbi:MAG TPA: TlpA disulfide reductase family protein [Gemmatimonadales bacterium]|nr:TlpA disulfide reductase family protein [Gemmatimonadales bacterium]